MFVKIKSIISRFVTRPEVATKFQEQKVKNEWQKIVASMNPKAMDKSEVIEISSRQELIVRVVNHLWLQEMAFYKEELKQRINQKNFKIHSIRFIT